MRVSETASRRIPVAAPDIREEDIAAVVAVLRSGHLAQGRQVEDFERQFADYIGVRQAVAVNSGTAALHLALLSHGVGAGDEVVTTPFSFAATANAILFCGARPVFVDIDADTYNIDVLQLERAVSERTRALLIVHLYGQPCDMGAVMSVAEKYGLAVIEDACQAHGAGWGGRKAGSFGTGCFSFYPTKNMTTGEGGMISTDDAVIAERCRVLRSHGQTGRYRSEFLGFNYRMTDIAAGLGAQQLERLEAYTVSRIENARELTAGLFSIPGLVTPAVKPGCRHVFHQYTIRVTEEFPMSRDDIQARLGECGIGSAVHYPLPIHLQPFYAGAGYGGLSMPEAERAAGQVLSLPVHPAVSRSDIQRIVKALWSCAGT